MDIGTDQERDLNTGMTLDLGIGDITVKTATDHGNLLTSGLTLEGVNMIHKTKVKKQCHRTHPVIVIVVIPQKTVQSTVIVTNANLMGTPQTHKLAE
ncbi:predicted protein [Pyrenophora tritici-repentis Pt-1C-BFP]|uniref:Uncharacterized protein n=1 Tax=Pyrenophora tritici-repentis (strain Pt-1C-BFP) TaxID=426418 RepID=B2W5P0_PYRTR|nr:uncharacterized protein PTRG_06048 [Pyrenophora tritici-repentis Pt-1C-BFP]EDU48968.1 predicted protein [Pyrenophora tritici-repentis Pt-1C-BFP]